MPFNIEPAEKLKFPAKVVFYGISGSGKTYSSLEFAKGLVSSPSKIIFIDTENSCGKVASEENNFFKMDLTSYDFESYKEALRVASDPKLGFECIIVDSLTPLWSWKGGWLEMHERLAESRYKNNPMMAWGPVNEQIREFIETLHRIPIHIIATVRAKSAFTMETQPSGKKSIVKVNDGLDFKTNIEYEFDLVIETQEGNNAICRKDRSGLFQNMEPRLITKNDGELFLGWCNKIISSSKTRKQYIGQMADYLIERDKLTLEHKKDILNAKGSRLIKLIGRLEFLVEEAKKAEKQSSHESEEMDLDHEESFVSTQDEEEDIVLEAQIN